MIFNFMQGYKAIIEKFFGHWFARFIRNIIGAPAIGGTIGEGGKV